MKRIGLFGGTFDPVHLAHVTLARVALDQLQLDEVRWVRASEALSLMNHATERSVVERAVALLERGVGADPAEATA